MIMSIKSDPNDIKRLKKFYENKTIDCVDAYGSARRVDYGWSQWVRSGLHNPFNIHGKLFNGETTNYYETLLLQEQINYLMANDLNVEDNASQELRELAATLITVKNNLGVNSKIHEIPSFHLAKLVMALKNKEFDNSNKPEIIRHYILSRNDIMQTLGDYHVYQLDRILLSYKIAPHDTTGIKQLLLNLRDLEKSLWAEIKENFVGNVSFEGIMLLLDFALTSLCTLSRSSIFQVIVFHGAIMTISWPGVLALTLGLAITFILSDPLTAFFTTLVLELNLSKALTAFGNKFKEAANNDQSLHPVLNGFIWGAYISLAFSLARMYLSKPFETAAGWAFGHKVLYPIMNVIFAAHTATIDGTFWTWGNFKYLVWVMLTGFVRGWIKDELKPLQLIMLWLHPALFDSAISIISGVSETAIKNIGRKIAHAYRDQDFIEATALLWMDFNKFFNLKYHTE